MPRTSPLLLPLCFLFHASVALAGDAIDTRVTFTIADDNLLKGAGETVPNSPGIPNSLPSNNNRLFFDDFEKRDNGFENLTHFVLYTHQPGFFEGLDTEAALVVRAEMLDDKEVIFKDDGSYVKLVHDLSAAKLGLTAFPISADRFRLGYSYDISWGGSKIFKGSPASPGLRIELSTDYAFAFLGAKTGLVKIDTEAGPKEQDTAWGILGGGGIDILDELRLEAGGGYFYRGTIDKPELRLPKENSDGFRVAPWVAYGGSAQAIYHVGMPIGESIDFRLYENDPLEQQDFFRKEHYNDGLSFLVQTEFSALGQTLQDPERPSSTVVQPAVAGDLAGRVKYKKLRVHALAVYRSLSFILFNVPSLSFVDFPDGIKVQPEYFLSTGLDYFFESAHFTPGFILGVQRPAYYRGVAQSGPNAPDTPGQQTFVYRSENDPSILEPGQKVKLIWAAKATAKWDLSNAVAAVGEFQYSYDKNRTRLRADPNGINTFVPDDPDILGFNVMLQARF